MTEPLFKRYELRETLTQREQKMLQEIRSLGESQALKASHEDLCKYFVEKYEIETPEIDESSITADHGDAQVAVSGRFEYMVRDRSRPFRIPGTRITFYVPFTGDWNLFHCRASSFSTSLPHAVVATNELHFVYDRTTNGADKIPDEFQRDLTQFKQYLTWTAKDLTEFNANIRQKIDQEINARREKLLQDRDLVANIGYPLRTREGRPNTYVSPEVRRRVNPQLPKVSDEPYRPEPVLNVEEYENILSIISNMSAVMERSPNAFKNMGEEDLRTHFLLQLNGHYEGQATAETFNYEGKTDILIRTEGKNIFIAECKFWSGPEGFKEAIDQLLGYTSWRDTKTALLIFNRNTNMSTVLERIPQAVKEHPSYKAEREYSEETGFRYIFGHRDDPNREVWLTILVFDVPR